MLQRFFVDKRRITDYSDLLKTKSKQLPSELVYGLLTPETLC